MRCRVFQTTQRGLWCAAILGGCVAASAHAAQIELIVNGEFENPSIGSAPYQYVPNGNVPGWDNTSGSLELWSQGAFGSPPNGTDTGQTGQHLELTSVSGGEVVSQTFTVPSCVGMNATATFNFDGWPRAGTLVNYAFDGTMSGASFFQGAIYVGNSPNAWLDYATVWNNLAVPVMGGEDITLRFWSSGAPGSGDGGTHVDQVSFVVECPDPTGACCLPDGTCQEMSRVECCTSNGEYEGDFVNCLGDEACCLPDGSCMVVDKVCCENELGGQAQGPNSTCEGDHDMNGTDDACEPTGACCLPWGACIVATPDLCESKMGTYLGDNTQCQGDEACCLPDGSCTVVDRLCCELTLGGSPQGAGSTCLGDGNGDGIDDMCQCHQVDNGTPIPDCEGACPDPGSQCMLGPAGCDCTDAGETGACCHDDGHCTVTTQTDCEMRGGSYHGDGTQCEGDEACCLPDGTCAVVDRLCCETEFGGQPHGPGTTCAGDGDGDGIDDACACGLIDTPDGPACSGMCSGPTPPIKECRPRCVSFNPATGQTTITDCDCRDVNECYVDVTLSPPTCAGSCPATGTVCAETQMQMADGSMSICCDCPTPVPGDCNGDQVVTASDYSQVEACITGPGGGSVTAQCECADLNDDGKADLKDLGRFQTVFSGP